MNPKSVQEIFWNIATEHRIGLLKPLSLIDFYSILEKGKQKGASVKWQDIHPLLKMMDKKSISDWSPPNFLIDFVISYFEEFPGAKALDPYIGMGAFASSLSETLSVEITGIVDKEEKIKIVELFISRKLADLRIGVPIEKLEEINGEFDIIFVMPPFDNLRQAKDFTINNERLTIKDSLHNIFALLAGLRLSQSGRAIFLLPETFYNIDAIESVSGNLGEFGLFLNSIISLPRNAFSPWAHISTSLFFVSRKKTDKLFIGKLSEDTKQSILLKNLIKRKNAKFLEMGRLINFNEYKSWRQYSLWLDAQDFVKSTKSPIVKLEEIALKINIPDETELGGFRELPNSIYLPLYENLQTGTRLSDLIAAPQKYVQISLKPDIALADYVAGFFNTDIGIKVRSSLSYGNMVVRLSKLDVMDAIVLLPDMDTQQEIIETQRTILELAIGLERLEKDLFQKPHKVKKIEKQIKRLNQNEGFESWIESLPFPLATILWRYHANMDVDEKVKHLLHFFEGTAQFVTTIMLSAFYSNRDIFINSKRSLFETKTSSEGLRRSTFGTWIKIGQKLSKDTRSMLSTPESVPTCLALYGTESLEFVNAISNKALFSTLEITKNYRNDFAHGGISNLIESGRKLSLLESELDRLRQQFAAVFEDHILIKPVQNQYLDGVYKNRILKVSGSRNIFSDDTLITVVPLDSNKLYFCSKQNKRPLEILPIVKLIPDSYGKEHAFYFYNRSDGKDVRWITYHYEKQPEITNQDIDVLSFLEMLENIESNNNFFNF